MEIKPVVYLIPGLAADETIYRCMRLDGYETRCIEWEDPLPGDDLSIYAKRFCRHIEHNRPVVLVGSSLGGIMAIEMAQYCHPQKIFLISSLKTHSEFPWYLRFFSIVQIYRIVPFAFMKWAVKRIRFMGSSMHKKEMLMISTMLDKSSGVFFKWAVHQVLHWKQHGIDEEIIHIHGTADKLFPIRYIKNPISVKGGNHFMVVYKGKEISAIILQTLNTKF